MRGLIALMVVAGVIAGVIFVGRTNGTVTNLPVPGGTVPQNSMQVVAPVRIVLECEEPTAMEAVHAESKQTFLVVKEQREGKLVRYLEIPEKLIERCGLEKIKDKIAALPGKASYEFDAPRDDTYYVFLRAKWYDSCGNSAWVRIDDNSYLNLEDENGKQSERTFQWAWHPLMLEGRPRGFALKAGKHTLHFAVREDGPWLDQWVISTEATPPAGSAPVSNSASKK
jgi:hypothetical protein